MPIDKLSANAFATGAVANSLGYTPLSATAPSAVANSSANVIYFAANGSIGIGTDSPGAGIKLDVQGGEIRAGRVDSSSEGGQISLARSSDNASAWYLDVYGNTSTPSLRVVDVSAGAVSLAINSSGAVALRGAVSASGVGITFPATQNASSDANTLDDYEEGSWTPRNSSGTALPINNSATYIKIGRLVFVNADINQLNQATVYGLPFTSASTGYPGVVSVGYSGYQNQTLTGEFNGGTTTLSLRYNGYIDITPSNNRFIIAGCYVASA